MQIFLSQEGQALVARIKGELDLSTADRLREELEAGISHARPRVLYLDLAGVSFMDSSGLGVILGRYRRLAGEGGKIVICRPQPQIQRLLELSGISKLVEIVAEDAESCSRKEVR
ncbi:MAG: STAS domain-containing protein [Moorellaceae bacterium]